MSKVGSGLIDSCNAEAALEELRERSSGRRPKGRCYLIVCEGTKTEPNYFEAIRTTLAGGQGDKVTVVGAQDNTLRLIKCARDEIEEHNRSDNPPYYHVWIVFDRDSFSPDDFDNAIKITELEDAKFGTDEKTFHPNWHAAWSNEAFELWYLMHFQENIGGGITRDRYKNMLTEHLGFEYRKNADDMFKILLPRLRRAIVRAKRADEHWPDGVPFHDRNPATTVYKLVSNLMMYA